MAYAYITFDEGKWQIPVFANTARPFGANLLPFDFRKFGISYVGDMNSGTPLEKVVSNLKNSRYKNIIGEPVRDTDEMLYDYETYQVKFEPNKGYWMTSHVLWGRVRDGRQNSKAAVEGPGKTIAVDYCKIVPVEVDGTWVPKSVELITPGWSRKIDFDWVSVNKTIDPDEPALKTVIEEAVKDGFFEVDKKYSE